MKRALFLLSLAFAGVSLFAQGQPRVTNSGRTRPPFDVVEATISEMQAAMKQGRITSRDLVAQYLIRIALYNNKLNGIITVNPRALQEADALDRERAEGKVRGPLHGIPVAIKDNMMTTNMPTTGGALAFDAFVPSYEATLVRNLRDAGAVIIAKTTMTELANWVAGGPTPMPGGYNALVGYSLNPYDPRRDPRDSTFDGRPALGTGGSSSAVGTAANFWAANVGTETSGSILSPANQNMLAAIKPTVGRISRYGIIPITADQDTAGPMAKTVTDAAILLGVLESPAPDPNDPATQKCSPPPGRDYTHFLKSDGLKGARIGIPRAFYYDGVTPPGEKEPRGGLNADQKKVMAEAIAILKQRGAMIVDPADIPSVMSRDPQNNLLKWNTCSGLENAKGKDEGCSIVLKYGMKRDFNKWLASLGPTAPVKTLTELRKFNLAHMTAGAIKYGQSQLDISDEMDIDTDRARYKVDRAKDLELAGAQGIDAALKEHNLDALLFPGATGAAIAAKPGYPTVIVPFGMVPNAPDALFPEGFNAKPAPFGVSFTSTACSETRLLELGYAFEHATKRRVPPSPPHLSAGTVPVLQHIERPRLHAGNSRAKLDQESQVPMKVACSSCGAQHALPDAQLVGRPRVQFSCAKCGKTTLIEVAQNPDATQVLSPVPEFARSAGAPRLGRGGTVEDPGLRLPAGKAIALSVIAGPAKGLVYSVQKPRVVMGRADADIIINDKEISRWHCSIEIKDDVIRLRDLESTNGTYFEDERVRVAELKHLAEFRIGTTIILLSVTPKLAALR